MKKLLIIAALLISGGLWAQNKGDNKIMVSGVSFKQVVNGLLDFGYKIDKIDSNYNTIRTEWREPNDKYAFKVYYDIRVKDSTANISGKVQFGNFIEEIQNQKWGAFKYSFTAMNDFAKSLSPIISYGKQ